MSIPGVKGILELEVGPTPWQTEVRWDGLETQLRAMNRPDHLLITAFLQKVNFAASPERCRNEWWPQTQKIVKQGGSKLQDLRQTSRENMVLAEFIKPEFKGQPVRQKSLHAYLGSRDLCAEVHLSKVQFQPEEQKLFEEVLATVKLLPEETAAQSAGQGPSQAENDLMTEASRLYLRHNYAAAAEQYQKVLDMEKQKPALNRTLFRVLVDNLGTSYGITGNLAKAKETFEYGITQQPGYPLFYYNLACTYGEMGKMDEALDQLRLAYKNKANMIPGEKFPDPMTDDSFSKFVKDKKFADAVKEMQK
jgi:tetratricopeptide (TPR) repeat protein